MKEVGHIPVYSLADIRKHVQTCAKEQWSKLRPEQLVCTGMLGLPMGTTTTNGEKVIEWFINMRQLFALNLPDTLLIEDGMCYLLVSSECVTYSEK